MCVTFSTHRGVVSHRTDSKTVGTHIMQVNKWQKWNYEVIEPFQYFVFVFYLVKRLFTQKAPIRERDREEMHHVSFIYLIVLSYIMSRQKCFLFLLRALSTFLSLFFFFFLWIGLVEKLHVLILASSTHDPLHLSAWAGVVEQSHLEIKQIKKLKIAEWVMRPANR